MELRKDAIYNVKISTPTGTLIELQGADADTAFSACEALRQSTKDDKLREALDTCMRGFGVSGYFGNGYSVSISARLPRTDTGERQTCGRRMTDFGNWERAEGLDTWNLIGKDRVCSFCGSLHPDRVIELIKEHGWGVIGRTDKGYKFYVHQPNVPNASFGGIKYYRFHDTPEFIEQWNELVGLKQAA